MKATPTPTVSPDWARYAACLICGVAAGQQCVSKQPPYGPRTRHHAERMLLVDRGDGGVMLLGRHEHVTWTRRGHLHEDCQPHHAIVTGRAACTGEVLPPETFRLLPALTVAQRCHKSSCRRLWLNEELMA